MQNTNKIKPAFPLSLLTCALALATGVASAQTIEVTNGETYTQNVVATDAMTSLTIQGGGTLDNTMQEDSRVVLKGGAFKMNENAVLKTKVLDIQTNNSGPTFHGTIEADVFNYRGEADAGYTAALNETKLLVNQLNILGTTGQMLGLSVSNAETLKGVKNILIETDGRNKTGLKVEGKVDVSAPVRLVHTGDDEINKNHARIEVFDSGAGSTFDQVIAKGLRTLIQANGENAVAVNNLTLEDDAVLNLQTYGQYESGKSATFRLNKVVLGDNAALRFSVYQNQYAGTITGEDIDITLGAGAYVDFGGWKEEGATDWRPDHIYIDAASMTFNIKDSESGNKIYLTGVEGNLTTDLEQIKVVADGANNTGNAEADLQKLNEIIVFNTKPGQTDDNNTVESVMTPATGVVLEQAADDIHDGATAVVDENGALGNLTIKANDNINGIAEMTAVGLHIWRNEINDMNKRLGELRDSCADANGVWARVYNGKAKFGSLGVTNKYTAFQFGYDHQIADKTWFGGAISWTDGDNDFAVGGGDSSLLAFTGYGSKLWDNGLFVDVTGKFGRIQNEYNISLPTQRSSADYHTNAVSISAEAGWRVYPMQNSFFIEPQVEMMFGHVWSADYTTSTGVNVEQDGADTLIGRAGFVLGLECPNQRGNAYVRASVLHDWKGDADFTFSKGGDARRTLTEELGGTWYEYGLGANFNVTKQIHGYADVEASSGGEVETDYRVNFGVRYSW